MANEENITLQNLADIYTFVRSSEISKTISNKTFDHYIKEALDRISTEEGLKDAAGSVVAIRPSKLERLARLEQTLDDTIKFVKFLQDSKKEEETP